MKVRRRYITSKTLQRMNACSDERKKFARMLKEHRLEKLDVQDLIDVRRAIHAQLNLHWFFERVLSTADYNLLHREAAKFRKSLNRHCKEVQIPLSVIWGEVWLRELTKDQS